MLLKNNLPVALTIAGSDSGGGAGMQADLRVFQAAGVHGTSVVTALTAQNPKRVQAVQPVKARLVRQQLESVFNGFNIKVAKTGMLLTASNVDVVSEWFTKRKIPLVVDPVMVSTSGTVLLRANAIKSLQRKLLPLAALVTPNIPEAEHLIGLKIRKESDQQAAARAMHEAYGCAVLLKGGHLRGMKAVDIYFDGKKVTVLSAKRVKAKQLPGTGCYYSAWITAGLAKGENLLSAIRAAKKRITTAISRPRRVGRQSIL
jgi:hydroxymethylpyrimidine/phosphomethylpyrimidine kinase